jgi:predicted sulfurtransferase
MEGGILKYREETTERECRWKGGCFVFDRRRAVGHGDSCLCASALPVLSVNCV